MKIAEHLYKSRDFRYPAGAVTRGSRVVLMLRIYVPFSYAALRIWHMDREYLFQPFQQKMGEGFIDIYFKLDTTDFIGAVWYYFIMDTVSGRRYVGYEGVLFYEPRSFLLTVYDENFETPKWFCEGLVYQIFPDRFFKGDTNSFQNGIAYHKALGRNVYVHEDWYDEPNYMPLPGQKHYEPCDYFGGTLLGIKEKLPYLHALGVTCIYMNPIFEAASNHRYNTSDYMRIDPMLGDEADFLALSKEADRYGIRLMLDGVFSHTGDDSVYFDRYGRYGGIGAFSDPYSAYRSWYKFSKYPDEYKCWWGFKSLPEVEELTPSYMSFIGRVIKKWSSFGIGGIRLDVADELPDEFIAYLRCAIKSCNPDSVLLGEVWENAATKCDGRGIRRRYVDGNELDSVMNYVFRDAVVAFLRGEITAYSCEAELSELISDYPKPFLRAQLNILGSHDTQRIITVLGGAPGRDALSRSRQAEFKLTEEARNIGKKRYKLALMIQLTYIGVPCIYYGDEVGLMGMADPFCRGTYPWGREDEELLKTVMLLCNARKDNEALLKGDCFVYAAERNALVIIRAFESRVAVCAVNRGDNIAEVILKPEHLKAAGYQGEWHAIKLVGVLHGKTLSPERDEIGLRLMPCDGDIFLEAL